jgi:hypothetical protein
MTWYQATRHSFVSRHLSRGASLDEVSAAVGHSSPVVTKRFYDHYVRRTFSPKLRSRPAGSRPEPARTRLMWQFERALAATIPEWTRTDLGHRHSTS